MAQVHGLLEMKVIAQALPPEGIMSPLLPLALPGESMPHSDASLATAVEIHFFCLLGCFPPTQSPGRKHLITSLRSFVQWELEKELSPSICFVVQIRTPILLPDNILEHDILTGIPQ